MSRPREFNPDDALERAMITFWAKGYHDTSMRDLIDATGVNQYGLYSAFGSKRGLFFEALRHYQRTIISDAVSTMKRAADPIHGIRDGFARLATLLRGDKALGCMMCNTAIELAPYDAEAAAIVQKSRAQLQAAFQARLDEAHANGAISYETGTAVTAAYLATTAFSIGMMVRLGCSDDDVAAYLETALSILR